MNTGDTILVAIVIAVVLLILIATNTQSTSNVVPSPTHCCIPWPHPDHPVRPFEHS
jgi:hypothetical protein